MFSRYGNHRKIHRTVPGAASGSSVRACTRQAAGSSTPAQTPTALNGGKAPA